MFSSRAWKMLSPRLQSRSGSGRIGHQRGNLEMLYNFEQKNQPVKSHPKRSKSNIARPHKKVNELNHKLVQLKRLDLICCDLCDYDLCEVCAKQVKFAFFFAFSLLILGRQLELFRRLIACVNFSHCFLVVADVA